MPRSTKHYCVGTVIYVRRCNLDIALDNSLYITRQSLGKQKQMANTLELKPDKGMLYTLQFFTFCQNIESVSNQGKL